MNVYVILAAVAISILALTEVLVAVQKASMKKQFLEELDRQDKQKLDNAETRKDIPK
jgi:hypothetical protein